MSGEKKGIVQYRGRKREVRDTGRVTIEIRGDMGLLRHERGEREVGMWW